MTDVVWDNDCFTCLISNNCYSQNVTYIFNNSMIATDTNCNMAACPLDQQNAFYCDPKFYITWFGTDVNGKQLKSSNLAMSRFRQYSIGSLYNSARDAFNNTINTLINTWDTVKNKTNNILNGNFS